MISPSFCLARLDVASAEDVIRELAQRLCEGGRVRTSFVEAALLRERRSPTGLPFDPPAVALPHAEPEHTLEPTLAIATLAHPIVFREMGSPEAEVEVEIVVMPAFSAKEQASASLSGLIELLQDDAFRARLLAAKDAAELAALMASAVP
jgi:PTS system galactitol-specific IIA component